MARVIGRQITRLAQYMTETVGLELIRAVMALVMAGLLIVAVLWLWSSDHTALLDAMVSRGVALGLDHAGIMTGIGLALYLVLLTAVNMLLVARYHELRSRPNTMTQLIAAMLVTQALLLGPEDVPVLTHLIDTAPDDIDLDGLVETIREPDYTQSIYAPEWPVTAR